MFSGDDQCPPGTPVAQCIADPCFSNVCPGVREAVCKPYSCGGCKAKWYLKGQEVTSLCNTSTCQPDEIFDECGTACEPNCQDPLGQRVCSQGCVRGCFCRQGFIRATNGRCISANECSGKNLLSS